MTLSRRWTAELSICLLLFCLLLNSQDQPLEPVRACTNSDITNVNIVVKEMLGVSVYDSRNPVVGKYPAKRFWSGNWYPLLATKQTMCGTMRYYKIPWEDQQDWNFFLEPTGPYLHIFQDALKYADNLENVWNCDGNTPHSSDD